MDLDLGAGAGAGAGAGVEVEEDADALARSSLSEGRLDAFEGAAWTGAAVTATFSCAGGGGGAVAAICSFDWDLGRGAITNALDCWLARKISDRAAEAKLFRGAIVDLFGGEGK